MFGTSLSDRKPPTAGWLTFATDSFGPAAPATTTPQPGGARSAWQRFCDWGTQPLVSGPHSATDAATRLEISALGGVRR